MKTQLSLFFALLLLVSSCSDKSPEILEGQNDPEPVIVEENMVVPTQKNIVTPEFWESFDTDMKVVYFYSKIDSLQIHLPLEKQLAKDFATKNTVSYHEYYTNDNMGMVQLNDSLFFDLTDYLLSDPEGFLLLKKGMIQNVDYQSVNTESFAVILKEFFKTSK